MLKRKLFFTIIIVSSILTTKAQSNIDHAPFFKNCNSYPDSSSAKRDCSNESIVRYISENLHYPEAAQKASIQGTVYVSFEVNEAGIVKNATLIRDIGGGCGAEAIRVVESMPRWEPAIKNGKPISVKLNIPVKFTLDSDRNIAKNHSITWGNLKGNRVTKDMIKETTAENMYVRDELGNLMEMIEMSMTLERNNEYEQVQSNGTITKKMLGLIKKLKKDDTFIITATVQKNGQFYFVERSFLIDK